MRLKSLHGLRRKKRDCFFLLSLGSLIDFLIPCTLNKLLLVWRPGSIGSYAADAHYSLLKMMNLVMYGNLLKNLLESKGKL